MPAFRRVATIAVLLCPAVTSPAVAKPRPATLSAPGAPREVVAAAGGGRTIVAWTRLPFLHGRMQAARVEARLGLRGGRFGPVQHLGSRGSTTPAVAVGAEGTAAAVWTQPSHPSGLLVAVAAPGRRRFGAPRRLEGSSSGAIVVVTSAGRPVVAWTHGQRIRYAIGTPRGRFGAPHTFPELPFAGAAHVRLALDRGGAVLIAWTARAGAAAVQHRVATLDLRSGRLGPSVALGPPGNPTYGLALTTGPGGAAAGDTAGVDDANGLTAALRRADGAWGPIETIARVPIPRDAPTYALSGPMLAVPAGAPPVAVWETVRYRGSAENPMPDGGEVVAATHGRDAWAAPVTLSTPGVLPGLPRVVAVRDRVLVAWPEPAPGGGQVRVATLGPTGPIGAPAALPGRHIRGTVALAGEGDRALAAWVAGLRVKAIEIPATH